MRATKFSQDVKIRQADYFLGGQLTLLCPRNTQQYRVGIGQLSICKIHSRLDCLIIAISILILKYYNKGHFLPVETTIACAPSMRSACLSLNSDRYRRRPWSEKQIAGQLLLNSPRPIILPCTDKVRVLACTWWINFEISVIKFGRI